MKPSIPFLLLCLALGAGGEAAAHGDAWFDMRPSAHGGQTRMAGPIHLELVRGAELLELFITDHADTPQPSAGGTAALRFPAQEVRVEFEPAGENRFRAAWPAAVPSDAEAVVFVKLAGQPAQSARFVPAGTTSATHRDHDDHAAHAH